MADQDFLNSIIKVAEIANKGKLTDAEIELLVKSFNKQTGSSYERAVKAITDVLGRNPEIILEKSASLDDINRLIADMKLQASEWKSSNKK